MSIHFDTGEIMAPRNNRDLEFDAILQTIRKKSSKKGLKQPMKKRESTPPEPEKFRVRLRKDHSFSPSTIAHFNAAYKLLDNESTHITIADFKRLVRHNGPIAVTMSNGTILIGHPYDF